LTAIEIRDLCKRYGSHTVVEGLSLEVARGSIYGLLGPNGSGKTTTLACTLGLLRASSGSTRVLGEPPNRIHRLGGRLSVVFDTAIALPALTADQNLDYMRRLLGHGRGRTNGEVLEAVGLPGLARAKVRAMSLGQAKRLAIAGALLGEPELLVLDEPLSGLDTLGVRSMLRLFEQLRSEGLTLLLSSHRLHEMQTVVTHVGILHGGRIVKGGTLDEVLGRGRGLFVLRTDRPREARELVGRAAGFECVAFEALGEDQACIEVHAAGGAIGALNRLLVEQGISVSGIEEHVETLQSVFEGLIDGSASSEAVA
jgi:ABC-2 type transport system ATP-binding protein